QNADKLNRDLKALANEIARQRQQQGNPDGQKASEADFAQEQVEKAQGAMEQALENLKQAEAAQAQQKMQEALDAMQKAGEHLRKSEGMNAEGKPDFNQAAKRQQELARSLDKLAEDVSRLPEPKLDEAGLNEALQRARDSARPLQDSEDRNLRNSARAMDKALEKLQQEMRQGNPEPQSMRDAMDAARAMQREAQRAPGDQARQAARDAEDLARRLEEAYDARQGAREAREGLQNAAQDTRKAAEALEKQDGEAGTRAENQALDDISAARAGLQKRLDAERGAKALQGASDQQADMARRAQQAADDLQKAAQQQKSADARDAGNQAGKQAAEAAQQMQKAAEALKNAAEASKGQNQQGQNQQGQNQQGQNQQGQNQ
ncbi:MAG: hypothetical protein KJ044_10685, partial [Planctomycetes bacterium]|nr:hypothetical protein [Planctomycetota bacterium]